MKRYVNSFEDKILRVSKAKSWAHLVYSYIIIIIINTIVFWSIILLFSSCKCKTTTQVSKQETSAMLQIVIVNIFNCWILKDGSVAFWGLLGHFPMNRLECSWCNGLVIVIYLQAECLPSTTSDPYTHHSIVDHSAMFHSSFFVCCLFPLHFSFLIFSVSGLFFLLLSLLRRPLRLLSSSSS